MAGALSDTAETLVLKFLYTTEPVDRPDQWFLALFSSATSDGGGGTELTDAGYSRQEVTFTVSGDTGTNDSTISFGPFVGSVTASYGAIYDGAGGLISHAACAAEKTAGAGDFIRFPAGTVSPSQS